MNPDQENLLSSLEREQVPSNSNSVRYNSFLSSKSLRKNLLLLILSLFIASCLTIYFYLNLVAIDGNQSDQTKYKPLSRRKPMLDHESIFSDSGPSMIRLSDLLAHCIVALKSAGQEVVKLSLLNNEKLNQIGSKGKTLEGVDDVVTGADLRSHEMIVKTIKDSYRRLNIVSEEDSTKGFEGLKLEDDILPIKRKDFARMLRDILQEIESKHTDQNALIAQHETLVWIDPLDATKEYSENLTEFVTLMACIVHKSVPIAGIIHRPFSNSTLWSMKDVASGSILHSPDLLNLLRSGEDQRTGGGDDQQVRIIISRSHAGDIQKRLDNIFADRVIVRTAGGSGYKTLELLAGKTDAYIHVTNIKKWDICAPHAILSTIREGNLTNMMGNEIKFDDSGDKIVEQGLIATLNQTTHRRLINSLKDSFANKVTKM